MPPIKDYYEEESNYFSMPCRMCRHRHGNVTDFPCCRCKHNLSVRVSDKDDTLDPDDE